MRKLKKKDLEKISVDRKIVEGLREGRSLTGLKKSTGKGKGYVIKVRDMAIEYGYIEMADVEKKFSKRQPNHCLRFQRRFFRFPMEEATR